MPQPFLVVNVTNPPLMPANIITQITLAILEMHIQAMKHWIFPHIHQEHVQPEQNIK